MGSGMSIPGMGGSKPSSDEDSGGGSNFMSGMVSGFMAGFGGAGGMAAAGGAAGGVAGGAAPAAEGAASAAPAASAVGGANAASATPDVISGASKIEPTAASSAAGETTINEVTGEGGTNKSLQQFGKTLQDSSKQLKNNQPGDSASPSMHGNTYNVLFGVGANSIPTNAAQPMQNQMQIQAPQSMQSYQPQQMQGMPIQAPQSMQIQPIQAVQPPPLPQLAMSDIRQKQSIYYADANINRLLGQIYNNLKNKVK